MYQMTLSLVLFLDCVIVSLFLHFEALGPFLRGTVLARLFWEKEICKRCIKVMFLAS